MTSIIQSNRERKSRLDAGLVERLNQNASQSYPSGSNDSKAIIEGSNDSIKLATNELRYVIWQYGKLKFPKTWSKIAQDVEIYTPLKVSFRESTTDTIVICGTNPYYAVAVDMFLRNTEYRLATLADVQDNLSSFNNYIDLGLVIRNRNGANKDQAKKLLSQINASSDPTPCWIDLRGLELDDDFNFRLTSESRYSTHHPLNWPPETRFRKDPKSGLPLCEDTNSKQKIYTSFADLSRGMMLPNDNLGCDIDDLFKTGPDYALAIVKVK